MTNKKENFINKVESAELPRRHPRATLRNKAEAELKKAFGKICEKYSLSFGEARVIISELERGEAYGQRKVEDKYLKKEND